MSLADQMLAACARRDENTKQELSRAMADLASATTDAAWSAAKRRVDRANKCLATGEPY